MCFELPELGDKHSESDGLTAHESSTVFPQVFHPEHFHVRQATDDLHCRMMHVVKPKCKPTYFRRGRGIHPEPAVDQIALQQLQLWC